MLHEQGHPTTALPPTHLGLFACSRTANISYACKLKEKRREEGRGESTLEGVIIYVLWSLFQILVVLPAQVG